MSGFVPGYNPDMNQGGGVPQPAIPGRLAQGGLAGTQISQSPEAQRALWAQQMGLDLSQPLNDFGQFILSRYQDVVRPWLGAMLLAGNPESAVPGLIGQLAGVAQGNGLDEFLRGSTGAFLGNEGLRSRLANNPNKREAAGMLRSIIGLGQTPYDPVFGDIATEQFNNALGQFQLGNAATGRTGGALYDFLAGSPEWNWMLR